MLKKHGMDKLKQIGILWLTAVKRWYHKDPFRLSAIIAYSSIFSLPGLLVVSVNIAGYFFGAETVNGQLHRQISEAMGPDTADQVQDMIMMAMKSRDSVFATIVGLITILVGSTTVFVEMQTSLNEIWEVKASMSKSGVWAFVKSRLFSFGLVVSVGFLLLISLVLSALLAMLSAWITHNLSESMTVLFQIFNFVLSLGLATFLFAMMFKILPDAKIQWRFVWLGAFVTAILFEVGKALLGLYFGTVEPGSGYGAAGSVVLILIWTSYTSTIVFFGAEFTRVYSDYYFGKTDPDKLGVKVPKKVNKVEHK